MHRVRKSLQWVRQFFAPSIPYTLVVVESPEICLRKIQSGLVLKSPERFRSAFAINQFFKIATDKQGNPQFRLLIKVEPRIFLLLFTSTVISGTFHPLEAQRTKVMGEVRSPWLVFLALLEVFGGVAIINPYLQEIPRYCCLE
ncbi:MAG: hypothetical protein DPW16_10990 [Chloroflexi bacterium]|nr:hypothetical protein [Chloroflexota bacterium]